MADESTEKTETAAYSGPIITRGEAREITKQGYDKGRLVNDMLTTAVKASRMSQKGQLPIDDAKEVYNTVLGVVKNNFGVDDEYISSRIKAIEAKLEADEAAALKAASGAETLNKPLSEEDNPGR